MNCDDLFDYFLTASKRCGPSFEENFVFLVFFARCSLWHEEILIK